MFHLPLQHTQSLITREGEITNEGGIETRVELVVEISEIKAEIFRQIVRRDDSGSHKAVPEGKEALNAYFVFFDVLSHTRLRLIMLLVDGLRNKVNFYASLIVVTVLHHLHCFLSLVPGLILNKKITWIGSHHLLTRLHEPVVLYLAELLKTINQVIVVLLPLLGSAVFTHVLSNCIANLC